MGSTVATTDHRGDRRDEYDYTDYGVPLHAPVLFDGRGVTGIALHGSYADVSVVSFSGPAPKTASLVGREFRVVKSAATSADDVYLAGTVTANMGNVLHIHDPGGAIKNAWSALDRELTAVPPDQTQCVWSDTLAARTLYGGYRFESPLAGFEAGTTTTPAAEYRQTGPNFAGLHYTLHRHYDPALMRFTSPDPAASPFHNLHAYCGNNPNAFFDPDGLLPLGGGVDGDEYDWRNRPKWQQSETTLTNERVDLDFVGFVGELSVNAAKSTWYGAQSGATASLEWLFQFPWNDLNAPTGHPVPPTFFDYRQQEIRQQAREATGGKVNEAAFAVGQFMGVLAVDAAFVWVPGKVPGVLRRTASLASTTGRTIATSARTAWRTTGRAVNTIADGIPTGRTALRGGWMVGRSRPPKMVGGYPEGSFSVINWEGYPAGIPRPAGPFRLLPQAEYQVARNAANNANRVVRRGPPLVGRDLRVHEIHPVKFGGDPVGRANKMILHRKAHDQVTAWWNRLQRRLE